MNHLTQCQQHVLFGMQKLTPQGNGERKRLEVEALVQVKWLTNE
jgi:hypothetical protein